MKTWKARIKEYGNDHILTPSVTGEVDRDYVIKWFGLDQPDVEWYELELVEE